MTQFNWLRAVEGALVTAVIAGSSSYQVASANHSATTTVIASTVAVTFLVAFIKGIGQTFTPPAVVQTTITQPSGTTAITETVASLPPRPVVAVAPPTPTVLSPSDAKLD